MSYIEQQDTNYQSKPISLYRFARGSILYCYNSSDRDITFAGQPYQAIPITDKGISQTGEAPDDDMTIVLPWAAAITTLFNGTAPSQEIFLTIMTMDFNDQIPFVTWVGTLTEIKRTDPATAEITCQSIGTSFTRDGLTLSFSRTCPYFLYDPSTCGVNPLAFQNQGVIESASGQTVVAEAFALNGDLYYVGGYIEWLVGGTDDTFERRAIANQVGDTLTLLGLADGLAVGTTVNIYPGCDRSAATCNSKFSNLPNGGMCNKLPGVSPFDQVNYF
jgi:uncharacterized phage protein (TIGR02218 family)